MRGRVPSPSNGHDSGRTRRAWRRDSNHRLALGGSDWLREKRRAGAEGACPGGGPPEAASVGRQAEAFDGQAARGAARLLLPLPTNGGSPFRP